MKVEVIGPRIMPAVLVHGGLESFCLSAAEITKQISDKYARLQRLVCGVFLNMVVIV